MNTSGLFCWFFVQVMPVLQPFARNTIQYNITLLPSVNTLIARGMFCGAKYTHHTFTPIYIIYIYISLISFTSLPELFLAGSLHQQCKTTTTTTTTQNRGKQQQNKPSKINTHSHIRSRKTVNVGRRTYLQNSSAAETPVLFLSHLLSKSR